MTSPPAPRPRGGRQALGRMGEDAAAAWYEAAGYRLEARNWRCREGELDLVLRRGRLLVVCEVKTRRSDRFGAAVEAVTASKQRRIRLLAARYLDAHGGAGGPVRFDVASVTLPPGDRPVVEVIEQAF